MKALILFLLFVASCFGADSHPLCDESLAKAAAPCEIWETPRDVSHAELSTLPQDPAPWRHVEANSDQRQPLYVGASPYEMMLHGTRLSHPELRSSLKALGEKQAEYLRRRLGLSHAEFEAWPVENDDGDMTWAFARYRVNAKSPWRWLRKSLWKIEGDIDNPAPFLPIWRHPNDGTALGKLLSDPIELNNLYGKPEYGDTVWTTTDRNHVVLAWPAVDSRPVLRSELGTRSKYQACVIPQPARFNEKPITFTLKADHKGVEFPKGIRWKEEPPHVLPTLKTPTPEISFATDFKTQYLDLIQTLIKRFPRRTAAEEPNDLEAEADWLENFYHDLGVKTQRQRFYWKGIQPSKHPPDWKGIPLSNVMAIVPGTLPPELDRPVVIADHDDVVFTEDHFAKTGKRHSGPGADDNGTATAAALMAAKTLVPILKKNPPKNSVIFLHLTGEEFPSDSLGARQIASWLLSNKIHWGPIILNDMIGYRPKGVNSFQINPGSTEQSVKLAAILKQAAEHYAPELTPEVRWLHTMGSYLYNTDGSPWNDVGMSVVLLNEMINRSNKNTFNPHYHQESDTLENVDGDYASAIAKVGIAGLLHSAYETWK